MIEEITQALEACYAIDEATEARLLQLLPTKIISPRRMKTPIRLFQLRSSVYRRKAPEHYLVPGFAVHWGLVIRHTLFHLRYFPDKTVKFIWCAWEEDLQKEGHEVEVIGSTFYNTDELIEIGIHRVLSQLLM